MRPETGAGSLQGPRKDLPSCRRQDPAGPGRQTLALLFLVALLAVAADPAFAADELFGTDSPLLRFVDFMVGPFAYGVTIVALVVTVGALMIGGEFSGFARRMPIVVVAGAIVILAGDVIKNLFGADRAADWPHAAVSDVVSERMAGEMAAFDLETAMMPMADALMHGAVSGRGGAYAATFMALAIIAGICAIACLSMRTIFVTQDQCRPTAAGPPSRRPEGSA